MSELKKIGVIKEELQAAEVTMLPSFIAEYKSDAVSYTHLTLPTIA